MVAVQATELQWPDVFSILFLFLLWICLWESWYYPWSRKREMRKYAEEHGTRGYPRRDNSGPQPKLTAAEMRHLYGDE